MERLKIKLPDTFLFTLKLRVRITDINYGNHVGNDRVVAMLHEVRAEWLRSHGFTELDINGTGVILADLAVQFTGEIFFGDELEIRLFIDNSSISDIAFNLYYSATKTKDGVEKLTVKAKTGMVCFNYQSRKPSPIPDVLRHLLDATLPK